VRHDYEESASRLTAIDDDARAFYLRPGLESAPTNPMHLMIPIKDVRAALESTHNR
jgi:hypothetical protein